MAPTTTLGEEGLGTESLAVWTGPEQPLNHKRHSASLDRARAKRMYDPRGPQGECLPGARPARARRATFVLTIPTSAPDLPSHGEAPQVDHVALHTFPTKHVAK